MRIENAIKGGLYNFFVSVSMEDLSAFHTTRHTCSTFYSWFKASKVLMEILNFSTWKENLAVVYRETISHITWMIGRWYIREVKIYPLQNIYLAI